MTKKTFPKLFLMKGLTDANTYEIWVEGNVVRSAYGLLDGVQRTSKTVVEGKNLGTPQEVSAEEVALALAQKRWDEKIEKGYKDFNLLLNNPIAEVLINQPSKTPLEYSGGPDEIHYPCLLQAKYPGVRCIFKHGKVYDKTGKEITTVPHITSFTAQFHSYLGLEIDGVLHLPGMTQAQVEEVVANPQKPGSEPVLLNYYIFDLLNHEGVYYQRFQTLNLLVYSSHIKQVRSQKCPSLKSLIFNSDLLAHEGYSELIIRNIAGPDDEEYSDDFLKIRPFKAGLFSIIGIAKPKEPGGPKTEIICETEDHISFSVESELDLSNVRNRWNETNLIGGALRLRYYKEDSLGTPLSPVIFDIYSVN